MNAVGLDAHNEYLYDLALAICMGIDDEHEPANILMALSFVAAIVCEDASRFGKPMSKVANGFIESFKDHIKRLPKALSAAEGSLSH